MKTRSLFRYPVFLLLFSVLFSTIVTLPSAKAVETKTFRAVEDANVASTGTSSGNGTTLEVSDFMMRRSIAYVQFNLSGIPAGAMINSVKLRLKLKVFDYTMGYWVSVFKVSQEWSESTINWTNKPLLGNMLATHSFDLIGEWYSWEYVYLENAVVAALKNGVSFSVALKSYILSDVSGLFLFYSRESGDAPELEIAYTPDTKPPSITQITVNSIILTPNKEITFSANISDGESGVKEAWLYYSTNNRQNWNRIRATLQGNSHRAIIPGQKEGTTITYYFEAFDNAQNRITSDFYSCTVNANTLMLYGLVIAAIVGAILGSLILLRKRRQRSKLAQTELSSKL